MILSNSVKRYLRPVLIISLLGGLALTAIGCEDFEQWEPTQYTEEEEKVAEETPATRAIATEDKAILAVYKHLLNEAESYEAKAYLADFYTTRGEWSAETELLKDGTSIWHVVTGIKMVGEEDRLYWQQASWFVLPDSSVIPSYRFEANALKIEADLQELSLQPD
jgi:hypothetical protein